MTEFFWKEPDVSTVLCELLGPQSLSLASRGHHNTKAATEDKQKTATPGRRSNYAHRSQQRLDLVQASVCQPFLWSLLRSPAAVGSHGARMFPGFRMGVTFRKPLKIYNGLGCSCKGSCAWKLLDPCWTVMSPNSILQPQSPLGLRAVLHL